MEGKKRIGILAAALTLLFGVVSCAVENNHLRPEDFADYLKRADIQVDNVRPLAPDPFRASSGVAILVAGSEIGVYKYDTSARVQAKRIERLKETGRTYINGIPYPVEVYGSFMAMGLEKNVRKHQIREVLHRFK
ncbi:MAG: hypothetical protein MJ016_01930 [Victivallaceae bacterium]|nr:hypothetical protein [Victivallaceae bacterium]